jgi:endonuclease/exonuclease/phosphatase family metal-dependent hydrolase
MKIRVATYNIHKGVSSLRSTPRVIALKKAIAEFDADVVFLQEVQGRHDRHQARFGKEDRGHRHWPETAQYDYFATDLHHTAYGMNALLSTYPIENSHNHDVSDHAYEQRGILHCVLGTPECPVHCYVVHLGLFEGGRGRQTQSLIDAVNASAPNGEPVIIAGDFNDWRNTLSDKLRTGLGVTEVFDELGPRSPMGDMVRSWAGRKPRLAPARTFPAMLPWFRLDRIYVRGFKVNTAQVMHGALWAKLSDHAPIVAELELS